MKPSADNSPKIIMQGIHVELTPALQLAIHQKFETVLRHDPFIVRLNIRLHKDQKLGRKYHYHATAQVECRGPDIIAEAEGKEAYATLDELSQKLDEQLEKRHERLKDKRNHPHEVEIDSVLPKVGESLSAKSRDEEQA